MRTFAMILFAFFLLPVVLTGCSSPKAIPLVEKENVTLNIGYLSEEDFEQRYANILQRQYPKLRYNIVPMKDLYRGQATVQEWMQQHQVDLLYIPSHLFQSFIDQGQLKPLEPYIEGDDFSLDNRVPEVMELTRLYGNGIFYGLPPTFYGTAIAYNKTMFDQAHVDHPTSGMSWNDLTILAQRFPHGLSFTDKDAWLWIQEMGYDLDLQLYNEETRTVTFNTDSWLNIWNSAIEPLRNGNVLFDDINQSPFHTGDRAMVMVHSDQFKQLEQLVADFQWDLITVPINPAHPDVSDSLRAQGYYAIPQSSSNSDDAWEVMQFMLSDRAAKWVSGDEYGYSTLLDQLGNNAEEKKHRSVFHQLRPLLSNPTSLPDYLRELAAQTLDELIAGTGPITMADLDKLQKQAELLLQSEAPKSTEE
ncbi:ABC transporter substrate-binding protein [Cohnella sp. WQ 127256]|uniref:ABC transporter substrate-binding protein n=1 Tax=Cohnella sp. WQ 127256 TaxID=2938790 RepID=UPI00211985D7|nr:extracellular solute-binding protein [Cohnella sp. WQ 127256]